MVVIQQRTFCVVGVFQDLFHHLCIAGYRRVQHPIRLPGQTVNIPKILLFPRHLLKLAHQLPVGNRHLSVFIAQKTIHHHSGKDLVFCDQPHGGGRILLYPGLDRLS